MSYLLGTNPIWSFAQNDTRWAASGTLTAYRAVSPSDKKAFYQDAAGSNPYPNPMTLDAKGALPPIYWNDDEPYILVLKDQKGNNVWTIENYVPPTPGSSPPVTEEKDFTNFISNPEFIEITASEFRGNSIGIPALHFAPFWFYEKSNTTATDKISFVDFLPGQSDVTDGSPPRYVKFECLSSGTGESYKSFGTQIFSVEEFQNTPISISFWARSSSSSSVGLRFNQYFGTGGSASADALINTYNLTPAWTKYIFNNYAVPSIGGKTIGEGDFIFLYFAMPVDTTCEIDLTTMQVNVGTQLQTYDYQTVTQKENIIRANRIPSFNLDPRQDAYASLTRTSSFNGGSWIATPNPPAGSIVLWPSNVFPDGWLLCNGASSLKGSLPRLYSVIGQSYGTALNGDVEAVAVSNVVTVSTRVNANVTDAVDVSTGMGVTVTQQGSASQIEIFTITTTSAATIPPGGYLTFSTQAINYALVYIIDGSGEDPSLPGIDIINVYLSSDDNADTVAATTANELHRMLFFLPDYRGYFLRGTDSGRGIDPDAASRTDRGDGTTGDFVGTVQEDEFKSHFHDYIEPNDGSINIATDTDLKGPIPGFTGAAGGNETRPKNININFIIKY